MKGPGLEPGSQKMGLGPNGDDDGAAGDAPPPPRLPSSMDKSRPPRRRGPASLRRGPPCRTSDPSTRQELGGIPSARGCRRELHAVSAQTAPYATHITVRTEKITHHVAGPRRFASEKGCLPCVARRTARRDSSRMRAHAVPDAILRVKPPLTSSLERFDILAETLQALQQRTAARGRLREFEVQRHRLRSGPARTPSTPSHLRSVHLDGLPPELRASTVDAEEEEPHRLVHAPVVHGGAEVLEGSAPLA